MKATLIILLSLIYSLSNAQAPDWLWAKSMGGSGPDENLSFAIDKAGNLYNTGRFVGVSDFDPGPGVYNLTSAGTWDIFISKLDNNGNLIWAKSIGDATSDYGLYIALDDSANIYITGIFTGTTDFDPGADTFYLTGLADTYILKLDSAGNFRWAKLLDGQNGNSLGAWILTDKAFNNYTIGNFSGTVDFDPGPGIYNFTAAIPGVFSSDLYILKLDTDGNFVWAKHLDVQSADGLGPRTAIDHNTNIYITGYFYGTYDFDPGPVVYNMTATNNDAFILKLDSSGNFLWAKQFEGPDNDRAYSIALNNEGDVFVSGTFSQTADFDPGPGVYALTSVSMTDFFICKLNTDGNFIWAHQFGSTLHNNAATLSVDSYGDVYSISYFYDTVDFDPGPGIFNLIAPTAGVTEMGILKLDGSGNFVWAKQLNNAHLRMRVCFDDAGFLFLSGSYGPSSLIIGSDTLIIAGTTWDIFISKLNNLPTGIEFISSTNDISVFPNPVTDRINVITSLQEIGLLQIYDLAGKKVKEMLIKNYKEEINISDLDNGFYILKINNSKFKIVKQ